MLSLSEYNTEYEIQSFINLISKTCDELIIELLNEPENFSEKLMNPILYVLYKQELIKLFNNTKDTNLNEFTDIFDLNALDDENLALKYLIKMNKMAAKRTIQKYQQYFESKIENRHYEWNEIQSIVVQTLTEYLKNNKNE